MENPYLVLTIHRSVESLTETPASTASASLDPDEKAALQMVFALRAATSAGLADRLGWDVRKVQRVLARLVARGSVVRIGRGRAARYEEPGETEGAPIEP
jgi:predicted HTH transcriptional regulator